MDTIADSDSADMGSIPVRGIFLAKIGLIVFKNVFYRVLSQTARGRSYPCAAFSVIILFRIF